MRTETKIIYQYDELPTDSAKQRAREWLAGLTFSDSNDWEHVYTDAEHAAKLLGITIDQRIFKTMGGGSGSEPCIWFSGFSSQGDGACFEGSYRYASRAPDAIKAYAPQDAELLRIAEGLRSVQLRYSYRLVATCKHLGHYSHSGCMSVQVEDRDNRYRELGDDEDTIVQLLRDFADWIYDQLEKEHDYQTEDAQIEESLRANEYEFDEEGNRA